MNLFSHDIGDLFRGDHALFQEPFEDFEGTAFQVFIGFLIELTVFADQVNQGFFLWNHGRFLHILFYKTFLFDLKAGA